MGVTQRRATVRSFYSLVGGILRNKSQIANWIKIILAQNFLILSSPPLHWTSLKSNQSSSSFLHRLFSKHCTGFWVLVVKWCTKSWSEVYSLVLLFCLWYHTLYHHLVQMFLCPPCSLSLIYPIYLEDMYTCSLFTEIWRMFLTDMYRVWIVCLELEFMSKSLGLSFKTLQNFIQFSMYIFF